MLILSTWFFFMFHMSENNLLNNYSSIFMSLQIGTFVKSDYFILSCIYNIVNHLRKFNFGDYYFIEIRIISQTYQHYYVCLGNSFAAPWKGLFALIQVLLYVFIRKRTFWQALWERLNGCWFRSAPLFAGKLFE